MSSITPIRKRIKQADIKGETIFKAMVESVKDYAIFVLDPEGRVATWNAGAQRIKGYTADEIIGRHFSAFYPEIDIRNGKPDMELRVAAQVGRVEDEGWRLRKDGTRFWANVVITAIRGREGQLVGFGKVTRDLTERRAAEQRYRLLVEGVSDYAIYSLDTEGNITSWNIGAQRIKGYTADEIIGKHFSTFYTSKDFAAGMPQKVLKIAEQEGHFEGEGWRVRKDGSRFWSSVVVTAIRDEEGKLTGFSKVTRDITDRKRLMDELRQHAHELEVQIAERERTNAELEAFSYSVSHDLRAPLRAIEGFASALEEDYGQQFDEIAKDYLSQIISASTRLNRLVHDLLDYGRLNRIELGLQPVELRTLIRTVLAETGNEARFAKLQVPKGISVVAHEPTLRQAIFNLISNAFKFRKPNTNPKVIVSAKEGQAPNSVRLLVTDSGIGIPSQHIEKIFKVFERLHGIEEYPGTGIGLAIVKRSIERMGGRVGVESKHSEGSTFWIELPKAELKREEKEI
jgi:PAS domain S-box-containing protein